MLAIIGGIIVFLFWTVVTILVFAVLMLRTWSECVDAAEAEKAYLAERNRPEPEDEYAHDY